MNVTTAFYKLSEPEGKGDKATFYLIPIEVKFEKQVGLLKKKWVEDQNIFAILTTTYPKDLPSYLENFSSNLVHEVRTCYTGTAPGECIERKIEFPDILLVTGNLDKLLKELNSKVTNKDEITIDGVGIVNSLIDTYNKLERLYSNFERDIVDRHGVRSIDDLVKMKNELEKNIGKYEEFVKKKKVKTAIGVLSKTVAVTKAETHARRLAIISEDLEVLEILGKYVNSITQGVIEALFGKGQDPSKVRIKNINVLGAYEIPVFIKEGLLGKKVYAQTKTLEKLVKEYGKNFTKKL